MPKIILQAKECPVSGELGISVKGTKPFLQCAYSGLLVAHDLLEHQQGLNRIGTIGDELIALGGIWFVRGQYGDINRNARNMSSAEESLATDFITLAEYFINGTPIRENIPARADSELKEIAKHCLSLVDLNSVFSGCIHKKREFETAAIRLFSKGYGMARRRYERKDKARGGFLVNSLFWEIAETLDKTVFSELYSVGQEWQLSYTLEKGITKIEKITEYGY